jgi:hypothetical protein
MTSILLLTRQSILSYAGAVILRIAYGHRVQSGRDHYVELAEELAHITTDAIQPGRWLVDSFPWRMWDFVLPYIIRLSQVFTQLDMFQSGSQGQGSKFGQRKRGYGATK